MRTHGMPRGLIAAAAGILALLLIANVHAKIDLVTLPNRDATELTIYKAEDLTLVRETRALTFDKGTNEIQFSWANTLIDPTSLRIRLLDGGTDFTVLDAHYPANSSNTIVWTIEARSEGMARAEIRYFASGVSWRADYKVIANAAETALRLEPDFTIFNNSGEDFENARTRLVVGEINLVEAIRQLAQRGIVPGEKREQERLRRDMARKMVEEDMPMLEAFAAAPQMAGRAMAADELRQAKEILKEAVSEYQLYSVEGTEDLENGWGKRLPNPRIDDIPFDLSYEIDPRKYGDQVVKFYKFKNDEEHELGSDPVPSGTYYVYSGDGRGGMRFQARTDHKYIPVGEDVELNLGSDGRVLFEPRVVSVSRRNFQFDSHGDVIGHEVVTRIELEIRNSNDKPVPVKLRRYLTGDWEIEETSDKYKKVDRETVEWEVDVQPLSERTISLTLVVKNGVLARNN